MQILGFLPSAALSPNLLADHLFLNSFSDSSGKSGRVAASYYLSYTALGKFSEKSYSTCKSPGKASSLRVDSGCFFRYLCHLPDGFSLLLLTLNIWEKIKNFIQQKFVYNKKTLYKKTLQYHHPQTRVLSYKEMFNIGAQI